MKKEYYLLFIIFITMISCEDKIHQIIINKDEISNLVINKDIINEKERNFYVLTTYEVNSDLKNEYFFNQEENGTYTLLRDSIEFEPDNVININFDNDNYQKEVSNYYLSAIQILESYDIKGLLGRKYKNHPNLEFTVYLNNGDIVEYRSDSDNSGDMHLKEYKEIEKGWFLYIGNK